MSDHQDSSTADSISFILLCGLTGLLCLAALFCCIYMCWYVLRSQTHTMSHNHVRAKKVIIKIMCTTCFCKYISHSPCIPAFKPHISPLPCLLHFSLRVMKSRRSRRRVMVALRNCKTVSTCYCHLCCDLAQFNVDR